MGRPWIEDYYSNTAAYGLEMPPYSIILSGMINYDESVKENVRISNWFGSVELGAGRHR